MNIEQVAKLPVKERFLYWVKERHQIYLRRRSGNPWPWTDDEILQKWCFTNPYREHDRTTVWLKEKVRMPMENHPRLLFAVVAFRWFNLITTGRVLLDAGLLSDWRSEYARTLLREAAVGGKLFSAAYLTHGLAGVPKWHMVCDYLDQTWHTYIDIGSTLATAHAAIQALPGMRGTGFRAAQVVCDLKYTPLLEDASDWWDWCSIGPGSARGLNLYLGRGVKEKFDKGEFMKEVGRVASQLSSRHVHLPRLHAQDVQNCLCEFSKYETALWLQGGKVGKRKYRPTINLTRAP